METEIKKTGRNLTYLKKTSLMVRFPSSLVLLVCVSKLEELVNNYLNIEINTAAVVMIPTAKLILDIVYC